jgi:hypothetical protein
MGLALRSIISRQYAHFVLRDDSEKDSEFETTVS